MVSLKKKYELFFLFLFFFPSLFINLNYNWKFFAIIYGVRGCGFINYFFFWLFYGVANEACEKLAVVGFNANMISYLTTQLHMPLTKAANTLTNFGGTGSLTPLIGAFLADAFAGRFWTITVASIIYQIVN